MAVLSSGELVVTGNFTSAGGVSANYIATYDPTTEVWAPAGAGLAGRYQVYGTAVAALPGGDVFVGGRFERAGEAVVKNLARYHPSTNSYSTLAAGFNDQILSLAVIVGGDVVAGGSFLRAGAASANFIARYNVSTASWSEFGGGANGAVAAMTVLPNGDLIVGGYFTQIGNVPALRIARFNFVTQSWTACGDGVAGGNSRVLSLLTMSNGDVIVGGEFTSAGGVPARGIARYSPATNSWSDLGAGIDSGAVLSLTALLTGDIVVGGIFGNVGMLPATIGVAIYSPIQGTWSPLGSGLSGAGLLSVRAAATTPSGDVIAAGNFQAAGGVLANSIAKYNPVSNSWTALGSGSDGVIWSLAIAPNGAIVAGGSFNHIGGVAAAGIATFDPASGSWSPLGSGLGGYVEAMAFHAQHGLLVGGNFEFAGNEVSAYFARWACRCPADVDDGSGVGVIDGAVTLDDLLFFLSLYEAGDIRADIDDGSATGRPDSAVTLEDLLFYLVRYEGGC
jgi:hypothetical protein